MVSSRVRALEKLKGQLRRGDISQKEFKQAKRSLGFSSASENVRSQRVKSVDRIIDAQSSGSSEQVFKQEQTSLRKTRQQLKEQGKSTTNVDKLIQQSQQRRFDVREKEISQSINQGRPLPAYATNNLDFLTRSNARDLPDDQITPKSLQISTVSTRSTDGVNFGSRDNPIVKTATASFRFGTGEQVLKYDDGRITRLNVNPFAELSRQGGNVTFTETTAGRRAVSDFSVPKSFKKEIRDGVDVYSPSKPVELNIKRSDIATDYVPKYEKSTIKTTVFQRLKSNLDARTTSGDPSRSLLSNVAGFGSLKELASTQYNLIAKDVSGEVKTVSLNLGRRETQLYNTGTVGGRAASFGLRSLRVPVETAAFVTESPIRTSALVAAGLTAGAVPPTIAAAFPSTTSAVSGISSGVGAIAGSIYIPGTAKRLAESNDLPKTTGRIIGEIGTAGLGYSLGRPRVLSTSTKVTDFQGTRKVINDQSITKTKYSGEFNQKTNYLDTKIKYTGKETQVASINPFAKNQIITQSGFGVKGTIQYQPKGAAQGLRNIVSKVSGGRVPKLVPVQNFRVYGNSVGELNVFKDFVSGTTSVNQLQRIGGKNVRSSYIVDTSYSQTVKAPKLQIYDGLKTATPGELSGFRTVVKDVASVRIRNTPIKIQTIAGKEVGLFSQGLKYPDRPGQLVDISGQSSNKKSFNFKIDNKRGSAFGGNIRSETVKITPPKTVPASLSNFAFRPSFDSGSLISSVSTSFPLISTGSGQRSSTSSRYKSITKTYQGGKLSQNRIDIPISKSLPVSKISLDSLSFQGSRSTQSSSVIQRSLTGQKQEVIPQNIQTGGVVNIITPITPPPVVPPPPPPPLFKIDFGILPGSSRKRSGRRVTSQSIYKADVTSKIFNLTTTKTPSFVTPFTNRPIVVKKKKKRSTRSSKRKKK